MARYGLPYQGSKSAIAVWIVANIPSGETFIDLFAGGCAVTHAAMLSRKWNRFIVNDINDTPLLFLDAVNGKYRNERRWISREDFLTLKDTDPYIASCWSFGNNRSTYLYSKEREVKNERPDNCTVAVANNHSSRVGADYILAMGG